MRIQSNFDLRSFVSLARRVGTDTQEIEVKSAGKQLPKDLVETISAFANASGGTLILGLPEKDGFRPVKEFDAKKMMDVVGQMCDDKLEPPVRASIDILPFEGSQLVVATIPETAPYLKKSRTPYGGSFVRTGDGDRTLSRYEVDRIPEERTQPRFDEEIVAVASVTDLDEELALSQIGWRY